MAVRDILLLGDLRLHTESSRFAPEDLPTIGSLIEDLRDTLLDFRTRYGFGRAIAAPQIGVFKRVVYLHLDQPTIIVNPQLSELSDATYQLWDDCLSFPGLRVRVSRHKTANLLYHDLNWQQQQWSLSGELSELIQHECDHLNGILATQRATDNRAFDLRPQS